MITKWTQHLTDPEEKKQFENKIRSARVVLERLSEILREEEVSLDRSELDIRTYDHANWSERQAHKNGYRSALSIVKRIITLDQQDKS